MKFIGDARDGGRDDCHVECDAEDGAAERNERENEWDPMDMVGRVLIKRVGGRVVSIWQVMLRESLFILEFCENYCRVVRRCRIRDIVFALGSWSVDVYNRHGV